MTATYKRALGIDVGAETIKIAEIAAYPDGRIEWIGRTVCPHYKEPTRYLQAVLREYDWETVDYAAVTGRMSRTLNLARIPIKQAQIKGCEHIVGPGPCTVVSIGSHGFSVLEIRETGLEVFRENSRCSQGTGNFLRQLVERFDMTIEDASALCAGVADPAPLSGRCPVILKTDMTHLANKGEPRERILAGLYDAVCENVQVLIKPRVTPKRMVVIGGVSQAQRIRDHFAAFAAKNGLEIVPTSGDDALFFEALGAAAIAAHTQTVPAAFDALFREAEHTKLEELPPLSRFTQKVTRLEKPAADTPTPQRLVLGFDIGSTGSKMVAVDPDTKQDVWQAYINTNGAPVAAAQNLVHQFTQSPVKDVPVVAMGATGSGREIVGSLMKTCYGPEAVFVINEIAAHAEGALHYDPRVDTIFEIGGQDAKYIRLQDGRVIDAAMNEACSAGTGSFIEEQGKKFEGIDNVVHLGQEALQAEGGVSLGQHCSVFMAEVIDEAVAAHVPRRSIIAGIYDSIIQNYLNRVKGSRSVGKVIFCQGMPFSSDALAAAVVRQTGSEVIVPPNPGTVGALGISLLAIKELDLEKARPVDVHRFLDAKLEKKDVFTCKSTKGCGEPGNRCRIDRLTTVVDGVRQKFTWGGNCSLYDKGSGKRKLPDLAPNPFMEREKLIDDLLAALPQSEGAKTVAISDEFMLKALFPLFATVLARWGFSLRVFRHCDRRILKRGIEEAHVPFCAPMQLFHGVASTMAQSGVDYLFLPMMRHIPRVKNESYSELCPIVQGSADILRADLGDGSPSIVSPVINIGKANFDSPIFWKSMEEMATAFGLQYTNWREAVREGIVAQQRFEAQCLEIGRRALSFCEDTGVVPVVVLGRPYTIYNDILNSNVPNILREQGAIAIPVDCYPVSADIPLFPKAYWGYGQRNLRAAHQVRRTPGHYSVFTSNYSCGPDSFNAHFYTYIMEGKPCAIIETDGHSGDAGTKTRIEAFLYCVHEDLRSGGSVHSTPRDFARLQRPTEGLDDIRKRKATVLLPRMGPGAEVLAGALRGLGVDAEPLPMPDAEALALGRRHTSGKECFPMVITLGSALQRLLREKDPERQFSFFMPTANGPCRFGAYNVLDRIVFERLNLENRVDLWSPVDEDYFGTVPDGFAAVAYAALTATDFLLEGLYTARPVEAEPGAAQRVWDFYRTELTNHLERYVANASLSAGAAIGSVLSGSIFGVTDLLRRAARAYRAVMTDKDMPQVLVTGEMYVRCDPFSNNFIIEELEKRGIRCKFAPLNEWLEYTDYQDAPVRSAKDLVSKYLQATMQHQLYHAMAAILDWPRRTTVQDSLEAARPYIREQLSGEAVLTIGGPLHEWRMGHIDGTVSVGPLECMPNKIAENQFTHIAEKEQLPSLTLHLNGDPLNQEVLDNFAYEIFVQYGRRKKGHTLYPPAVAPRAPMWKPYSRVNPRQ